MTTLSMVFTFNFLGKPHVFFLTSPVLFHNKERISHTRIRNGNKLVCVFFACYRDLLLPDGNRVSAFSVASTAIAAAQWSSSQVGSFSVIYHLCPYHHCYKLITHSLPFQPQQSSEGMSEYSYMQEGYPPLSQVSKLIKADKGWGDSLT